MNIYNILRMAASGRIPSWAKLLGLAAMLKANKRILGVFIDPAMACNLRCRMCYFSDPEKRAQMHGTMSDEWLDAVDHALFGNAMKLQIGCGAEPTLYPRLAALVEKGRKAGIPYISVTTNGQLMASGRVDLKELAAAGLDEITLSMHGTKAETYEFLMPGARFDLMQKLIAQLAAVKQEYPDFKIRVNYTINSLNVHDLENNAFWKLWDAVQPDIVQLRPVQKIGESEWTDFDLSSLKNLYDATIGAMAGECKRRGITCIAPTRTQLDSVATDRKGSDAIIEDLTYCYVSPDSCYKADFDPATDTFRAYCRRKRTAAKLVKAAFGHSKSSSRNITKKLNYTID